MQSPPDFAHGCRAGYTNRGLMGDRHDYRDAYGQHARIVDEQRGKYPFRLLVYTPNGCCSHNGIYATERAAKMALRGLGYCWSETRPATAWTL